MRYNNIEFRWSEFNDLYELVKWYKDEEKEFCYVVAFFRKKEEGYDMETIGNRFFEDHDAWVVGKHAMGFLRDVFEDEKEGE